MTSTLQTPSPIGQDASHGLGPYDLEDPPCIKMSAATGGVTKKRKKTDTKPQAQANKCLNEKRRREEENQRIEELASLISLGFEMSSPSVKPDKCAILQETVKQIRRIKQQESGSSSDAVQQEEVSSSKPTILANEVSMPLLLEALEGFLFVVNTEGKVEFVTENISQFIRYTRDDILGKSIYNIIHHGDHTKFSSNLMPISLGWTNEPQQHSRGRSFNCRLLVKPPDDRDQTMEEKQQRVSQYENMLISSVLFPYPSDKSEEGGSGGSGGSGGEVSSESSEVGPCLMCVARRVPANEKQPPTIGHPTLSLGSSNQIGGGGVPMVEQFTMKLDTSGRIIGVDTTGVSSSYSQYLKELMGLSLQDLCHQQDQNKLSAHLKETVVNGHGTSAMYRLRVMGPDGFLHVQTKSKLFKSSGGSGGSSSSLVIHEPDFIMATNSIIGDHDLTNTNNDSLTASGNSPRSLPPSVGQQSSCNSGNNNSSVGGLLQSPQGAGGSINGQITHASSPSPGPFPLNPNDYGLPPEFPGFGDFFPSSSWDDMGPDGSPDGPSTTTTADSAARRHPPTPPSSWGMSGDAHHPPRPDSVRSLTPASTPGPPPNVNTAFSPSGAGGICPSPLEPYSGGTRPSPASCSPFGGAFPFSPIGELPQQQIPRTPSYGGVVSGEESSPRESEGNLPMGRLIAPNLPLQRPPPVDSARLRNLLTKRHVSGTEDEEDISEGSSASPVGRHKDHILKGLLNQNDEEESGSSRENGHRGNVSRMASMSTGGGPSPANDTPRTAGNNNMLLKLLNEKSDDDDLEARAGLKKQNELLHQLMKDPDGNEQAQSRWGGAPSSPMVSPHPSHTMHHHQQHSASSTPQTPPTISSQEDSLLKSLVCSRSAGPNPHSPPSTCAPADSLSGGAHRVRKRPGEEGADDAVSATGGPSAKKKPSMTPSPSSSDTCLTSLIRVDSATVGSSSPQVSSSGCSGQSNLCQKNRMLAELLAQKPSEPANIPPIPASVISARPQEVLPRVTEQHKHSPASTGPGPGGGWSSNSLSSTTSSGSRTPASSTPVPSSTSFSESIQQHHRNSQQPADTQMGLHIQHHSGLQQQQHQLGSKMQQGHAMNQQSQMQHHMPPRGLSPEDSFQEYRRSVAESMGDGGSFACVQQWGENQSSDPILSSILDEVIDIVPDAIITDTSAISDILVAMDGMGDALTPSSTASSSSMAHSYSVSSSTSASVSSSTSSASISSSSQIGPPAPRPPTSSPASSIGPSSSLSAAAVSSYQQDMNAKLAINAIQKSLMLCESAVKAPNSPVAPMANTPPGYPPSQVQGGFPQPNPPLYGQRPPLRFSANIQQQHQQSMGGLGQLGQMRGPAPQYGMVPNQVVDGRHSVNSQALARRKMLQQAQKQRLLQQQQQQVLVNSGAAAAAAAVAAAAAASANQQVGGGNGTIVGGNTGVDSALPMDSLLNSSIAPPNVSLQRSTSVPDSQLSPGYGASSMLGSPLDGGGAPQISPGSMQQRMNQSSQQPPFSPHGQLPSPIGQQGFSPAGSGLGNFGQGQGNGGPQARLSPHQSQGSNNVGSSGGGGLPSFQQSQLSPRIPQIQGGYGSGGVMGTPGGGSGATSSGNNTGVVGWTQAQVARLSLQQQQNPMLNAQLTGNYGGGGGGGVGGRGYLQQQRQQQQQQQQGGRSLSGSGATSTQHGGQSQQQHPSYLMEVFPGSVSPPNSNLAYQTQQQQQQFQQQQMRLQRTISAPGAPNSSSQGGVNASPRHYMGSKDRSSLLLSPPLPPPSHHGMPPIYHSHHPPYMQGGDGRCTAPMYHPNHHPMSPLSHLNHQHHPHHLQPPQQVPPYSIGTPPHPQQTLPSHTPTSPVPHQNPSDPNFCMGRHVSQIYGGIGGCERPRPGPANQQPGGGGGNNSGGGGAITSEYVRLGLRAVVGARAQQQQHQTSPASTQASNPNQGHQHNMRQQQQMTVSPTDLEALGLSFEMPSSAGPEGSPKLWPGLGADLVGGGVAASPSPGLGGGPLRSPQGNNGGNSSNGSARGHPVEGSPRPQQHQPNEQQHKSSLLQKLLSE